MSVALESFIDELEKISKEAQKSISAAERVEWNARKAVALRGRNDGDGCSLGKDARGFYCRTHRARSKSYPSPKNIPIAKIRFVASTA